MDHCKNAFKELKEYLGSHPLLSKPVCSEILLVYLVISTSVVNVVLVCQEGKAQLSVYHASHSMV